MLALVTDSDAVADRLMNPEACDMGEFTLHLFSPTTPFSKVAEQIKLVRTVAALFGVPKYSYSNGRAYARAWDFARAVKNGGCKLALVDATYLAASGAHVTVLAAASHRGRTDRAWQLVARGDAKSLDALRGKTVLVPNIGGREMSFVENGLFLGKLPRNFFRSIDAATDTASAFVALTLGKADAAIVPIDVVLPSGVTVVEKLPSVSGPLLVAYYELSPQDSAALTAAALAFHGTGAIDGFVAPTGHELADAAQYFTVAATPKK